jgi:hypothetical protein
METIQEMAAEFKAKQAAFTARFDATKAEALRRITYPHDGPVTPHVMICRAMNLSRAGKFPTMESPCGDADPLSEALAEALGHE